MLIPRQQLELIATGHWQATGPEPEFVVDTPPVRAGVLQLRLKMTTDTAGRLEVRLDQGSDGVVCAAALEVASTVERTLLVHVPRPVQGIRLRPLDRVGRFRIDSFDCRPARGPLVWMQVLAAKMRLLARHGIVGRALWRGGRLLLHGQFGEFRYRLLRALDRSANVASDRHLTDLDYQAWRRRHALTDAQRVALRQQCAALAEPPLISVLMPVCDPDVAHLRAAIDSVRGQLYPYWQLCLADDASTSPVVRRILDEAVSADQRFQLARLPERQGIAAASNAALALATGAYAAFLDHDDMLAEHALARVACAGAADVLYSDEDKLDEAGRHIEPYFKPDWSPELLLSSMYLCHLLVIRRNLVTAVGGFRSAFDGAQDYDLALRATAQAQRIVHIPDILYHWRKSPGSTATGNGAKPQAAAAGQRALTQFLGPAGQVEEGAAPGLYRVRRAIPDGPLVSIIIPSACRQHADQLTTCLANIGRRTTYRNYEIVVVHPERDADAGVLRALDAAKVRRVTYAEPFGWAMAMNGAAAAAAGRYLLFLNDDTEVVTPDWIEALLECGQSNGVGAVGAKLRFSSGDLQHAGITVADGVPRHVFYRFPGDHGGYFASNLVMRNCSAVTGACLLTPADVFRALGGFDEGYALDCSDIDYCLHAREQGLRIVWTPYAELIHHEAATRTGTLPEETARFRQRWAAQYPHDPYCNPHLAAQYGDYRIDLEGAAP